MNKKNSLKNDFQLEFFLDKELMNKSTLDFLGRRCICNDKKWFLNQMFYGNLDRLYYSLFKQFKITDEQFNQLVNTKSIIFDSKLYFRTMEQDIYIYTKINNILTIFSRIHIINNCLFMNGVFYENFQKIEDKLKTINSKIPTRTKDKFLANNLINKFI